MGGESENCEIAALNKQFDINNRLYNSTSAAK